MRLENGDLRISVEELFGSLNAETRIKVARQIGADAEAWRQMAEALADPGGFFNGDDCWWLGSDAMLEVRAKLLPLAPENARLVAELLQRKLDQEKADARRYHDWAWAMYHAHNGISGARWPEIPDWAPAARDEMRVRDAAPEALEALRELRASFGQNASEERLKSFTEAGMVLSVDPRTVARLMRVLAKMEGR